MAKMTLHIGANISGLQSALGKAKNMITGWAGALGGMFTAAGFVAFGKSAIEAADAVADGSKRVGLSAEEYQKLSYAAKQTGTDMSGVEAAFKKMSSTVADARNGNKQAIDTLAKLGISIDDLKGKSPDQIFSLVADALNMVADATDKAALAQDVFGKGGMQIIPMLGTYKELGQDISDAGGVMSNEAVAAADALCDSLNKLATVLKAGFIESGFVKWLTDVVNLLNDVNKMGGVFQVIAENFSDVEMEEAKARILDETIRQKNKEHQMGTKGPDKELEAANQKRIEEKNRRQKIEDTKNNSGAQEGLDYAAKESARMEAEGKAIIDKQNQSVKDSVSELQKKIDIQKMVNAGKEKEAAIQEAINDAESKAGRSLSEEEKAAVSAGAGSLYDLSQKDKTKTVDMVAPAVSDAVQRIGGSIGNAQNTGKQQVDLLKMISDGIKSLDQKTTYDVGGGTSVWP